MTDESVETPIEEVVPVAIKARRVCSTLIDMVCALIVTVVILDICHYAIGLVSKVIDAETSVPGHSFGYGWDGISGLAYFFELSACNRVILSGTPFYIGLILLSPLNLGRRIMRLGVESRVKPCSTSLLMARESIKFLWLLPLVWIPYGTLAYSTIPFQMDIAASFRESRSVVVFPVALLVWVFGRVEWSIHDIVCKTHAYPTSRSLPGCLVCIIGSALYGGVILFLIIYSLFSNISSLAMRGIYLWDLTGDFSAGEGDVIPIYEGLPRCAATFDFYTGAVLVWTLIVFLTVRVQDRPRDGCGRGASDPVEQDRVGQSTDETSGAGATVRP